MSAKKLRLLLVVFKVFLGGEDTGAISLADVRRDGSEQLKLEEEARAMLLVHTALSLLGGICTPVAPCRVLVSDF